MGNHKNLDNLKRLRYHYIYKIYNTIDYKMYIGRHSTNDLDDGYFGSGILLKRAINKHGIDKFRKVILRMVDSLDEAVELERLIVDADFIQRQDVYNLVEGGTNPIMYGEQNKAWKGGVSKSPTYRIKGPYDFTGKNNPNYGKSQSAESRLKNLLNQKTRVRVQADSKQFNSIKECSRYFGMRSASVCYRLESPNFPEWFRL